VTAGQQSPTTPIVLASILARLTGAAAIDEAE
jgi:hypothetical protein